MALRRTAAVKDGTNPDSVVPVDLQAESDRLVLLVGQLEERRRPLEVEQARLQSAVAAAQAAPDADAALAASRDLAAVEASIEIVDGHLADARVKLAAVAEEIDRRRRLADLPRRRAELAAARALLPSAAEEFTRTVLVDLRGAQARATRIVDEAVAQVVEVIRRADGLRSRVIESAAALAEEEAALGVDVTRAEQVPNVLNDAVLAAPAKDEQLLVNAIRFAHGLKRSFPTPRVP
jgi:hypothetical protein